MHILEHIRTVVKDPLSMRYNMQIDDEEWNNLICAAQKFDHHNIQMDEKSSQKTALSIIKRMYIPHEKQELHGFLKALSKLEPQANIIEVEVRDHVVHAVNTFLLGVYIIEKTGLSNEEKNNLAFQWKICGPTHDIGYTYELLLKAMNKQVELFTDLTKDIKIHKLYLPEIMPRNIKKLAHGLDSQQLIQKRLADWGINFNIDEYIKVLRENNTPDHGIISAFLEMKYLDALYHSKNKDRLCSKTEREIFYWDYSVFDNDIVSACAAVLLHNIKDNNINTDVCESNLVFNFNKTPLPYILFLCDSFQEWDRYGFGKETINGEEFSISASSGHIFLTASHSCSSNIERAIKSRLEGLQISLNGTIVSK